MTREEVIKALDCCMPGNGCVECPYKGRDNCIYDVNSDAIKLIEQDREQETVIVDKYRIYNKDDLMDEFFKFIRTEVEWWYADRDAHCAESCMHHIAGATALLGRIFDSCESLVRKEKADANKRL